jgi:hypothetical protein
LYGERKLLDPPSETNKGLRSFHRREHHLFYANRRKVLQAFGHAAGQIVWKIGHGHANIRTGLVRRDENGNKTGDDFLGITSHPDGHGEKPIEITLAMSFLTPFLDKRRMTVCLY